ncbi:MAG TPA: transcription elongation factor subunit Spt4 [Candidatus Nanoarchaeia archaeon]|nr:transcription elongation factor subunit Spt4 [Candidatus Nanoarchaeia archaeon]
MAVKACKACRRLVEGTSRCTCGSEEFSDSFKGKIAVLRPEESEIAQQLGIKEKGSYAIKLG